ncbi:transcriptional regulator [Aurantimonas endophytica]|nr:MucR family transcriptional regulator [Aurantimonas endophytica]MCO6406418.1 transcriptional regulator [Aurantimonas endophytica]
MTGRNVQKGFDEAVADGNISIELAARIVAAFVSQNSLPAAGVPDLIATVQSALADLGHSTLSEVETLVPAVSIRKSIKGEQIFCMDCGKPHASLKRHLGKAHGLDPAEYREKWGLRPDYPMVAPAYSARRSALAKQLGLGRRPNAPAASEASSKVETTSSPSKEKKARPAPRRKVAKS